MLIISGMKRDIFNLSRFEVQSLDLSKVQDEIRNGRKESHWIWYHLPQLSVLGSSGTAKFYGISCGEEARRYVAHETFGPRLVELCNILLAQKESTDPIQIFGHIDAIKTRSCMTLFRHVKPDEPCFDTVLRVFYDGKACSRTIEFLKPFAMEFWEGSLLHKLQPADQASLVFPPPQQEEYVASAKQVVVSHGLFTGDTYQSVLADAKGLLEKGKSFF